MNRNLTHIPGPQPHPPLPATEYPSMLRQTPDGVSASKSDIRDIPPEELKRKSQRVRPGAEARAEEDSDDAELQWRSVPDSGEPTILQNQPLDMVLDYAGDPMMRWNLATVSNKPGAPKPNEEAVKESEKIQDSLTVNAFRQGDGDPTTQRVPEPDVDVATYAEGRNPGWMHTLTMSERPAPKPLHPDRVDLAHWLDETQRAKDE